MDKLDRIFALMNIFGNGKMEGFTLWPNNRPGGSPDGWQLSIRAEGGGWSVHFGESIDSAIEEAERCAAIRERGQNSPPAPPARRRSNMLEDILAPEPARKRRNII